MLFMVWLLEQGEREDHIGRLCRVIKLDYNNGCLPALHDEQIIVDHFLQKHLSASRKLIAPLLNEAHLEFNIRQSQ